MCWNIDILTAIGLTPGGSSTVHIYTQTIHRTTQLTTYRTSQLTTNWEECWPCPVFASYTVAFALQLRKKHGKTSVKVLLSHGKLLSVYSNSQRKEKNVILALSLRCYSLREI